MNTLNCIIPIPLKAEATDGFLPLADLSTYTLQDSAPKEFGNMLSAISRMMMLDWRPEENGQVVIALTPTMPAEHWVMDITQKGINIRGGDRPALRYALDAFLQMLTVAARDGAKNARLTCGHIEDSPRFAWRGLLLDSARHFQRPEVIQELLKQMGHFRLNKLHWHLIDSEGFRIPSSHFPEACKIAEFSGGCYTANDLREIEETALAYDIEIIPELDAPGHFAGFLKKYPEYACAPDAPGNECCLGNPKTLEMVKSIYQDATELLPHSKRLHVGGDEAETTHWEKCPRCQNAMKTLDFHNTRQLEHHFMAQLKDYVRQLGRQPISWSIPSNSLQNFPMEFSKDDIIQTWLDLREPIFWAEKGNQVIYSLHTSLYLDYPRNFSETHEEWMFTVTEQSIYLCEPFGIWPELVQDAILGTEACLWTETVPEWRVMQKLMPRLPAYSECCWSAPARKDWYDFSKRREILEGAGYYDLLRRF